MTEEDEYDQIEEKISSKVDRIDRKVDSSKIREKEDDALKVVETVFDSKTRLLLMGMINRGVIEGLEGAISTGKEANVYFAQADPLPVAVKIFRIDIQSFKKMRPYIEGDHRFRRFKKSRSGFITSWAKKEFKNLKRMHEHGIPGPQPLDVERNILVMEYLGTETAVLPLLKESQVANPSVLYKNLMEAVKDLYQKAQLVHADLSEFNILFDATSQQFYIIDVSQAVLWSHPRADEFLIRDLHNLNRFFASYDIKLIELRRLYRWITGDDPSEAIIAEVVGID